MQPLKLTLSGDTHADRRRPRRRELDAWTARRLTITPHIDFPRAGVEEEALRTARFCAPEHDRHEVAWAP